MTQEHERGPAVRGGRPELAVVGRDAAPRTRRGRPNLKVEVASYVRDLVFSASLRPGERVDQEAIAEAVGASRVPVREALIMLEAEGLVVSYPNRGVFIAELTPDDIHDTYLILGRVSALAAARAASRISVAETERVRELFELLKACPEADAEAEAIHHNFHRAINLVGGSRRLTGVLRSLTNTIPGQLHFAARGITPEVVAEHLAMLVALEARDPERAAAAAVAHFTNGARYAVTMLTERGFWNADGGAMDPAR